MGRERAVLPSFSRLAGCSSREEEVGLLGKEVGALQREIRELREIGEESRARTEELLREEILRCGKGQNG